MIAGHQKPVPVAMQGKADMNEHLRPSPLRFFHGDDGTEIAAGSIRIELPDGRSFSLDALPGRDGAAVFHIPGLKPDEPVIRAFVIEPGASNLFAVRVVEWPRRVANEGEERAP